MYMYIYSILYTFVFTLAMSLYIHWSHFGSSFCGCMWPKIFVHSFLIVPTNHCMCIKIKDLTELELAISNDLHIPNIHTLNHWTTWKFYSPKSSKKGMALNSLMQNFWNQRWQPYCDAKIMIIAKYIIAWLPPLTYNFFQKNANL